MKLYDMYGPEGTPKMQIAFRTKEEVEEEKKENAGIWIKGVEYFDVKKLEKWLPWKRWNIRRYIRSGKIRGRKIKRVWFVSREELYNFLGGK